MMRVVAGLPITLLLMSKVCAVAADARPNISVLADACVSVKAPYRGALSKESIRFTHQDGCIVALLKEHHAAVPNVAQVVQQILGRVHELVCTKRRGNVHQWTNDNGAALGVKEHQ